MEKTIFDFFTLHFKIFFLVFIRITALYFTAPFFSNTDIPSYIRAGFAFFTALIVYPVVNEYIPLYPDVNATAFFINVLNQVIIRVIIGIIAQIFYLIIQVSGQYYTMQIGFGMINTLDPMSMIEVSIIGSFQGVIGLMLFLLIGGHHFLIYAIVKSFSFFPLFNMSLAAFTAESMTDIVSKMFYLGFMYSIPVMGIIFIMTLILGILAKIAPQMNLLMLGFPLNILVGLSMLLILQSILFEISRDIFANMFEYINQFLNVAKKYA